MIAHLIHSLERVVRMDLMYEHVSAEKEEGEQNKYKLSTFYNLGVSQAV